MSTKDRSGTLPVNAYEEEIGPTEIFNFFNSKIIPCHLHYTKRQVLMRIVNRKPLPLLQKRVILHLWYKAAHQKYWPQNPVRFFVVRFEEDVLASDPVKTRYKCLWFSEDLLPFHFTDSGIENVSVVSQGILEYGIAYVVKRGP